MLNFIEDIFVFLVGLFFAILWGLFGLIGSLCWVLTRPFTLVRRFIIWLTDSIYGEF